MVAARRRPVATHAPVGAVPTAFFLILNMMAALPPRPKAPFYLCIYLFASFLIAET
jgi:hypothetical protein